MKKKFVALFLLTALLLPACAKQETTTPSSEITPSTGTTPLPQKTAQDVDNTFLVNDNFERMTQSDNVIYKLSRPASQIIYYDKVSGISGPLCGKPDCSHTGTDCNAYVSDCHSVQYYDGSLYFIALDKSGFPSEMCLWKCDPSGGNREKIRKLDYGSILVAYQPQQYYIHRGVLYLLCNYFTVSGAKGSTHATVLALSLDDSDDFTILWEKEIEDSLHPHFRFFDKFLYICAEQHASYVEITRINTETKEPETIFAEENQDLVFDDIAISDDGSLYLAGSNEKNTIDYVWAIRDGKREEVLSIPVQGLSTIKILDGYAVSIQRDNGGKRMAIVKSLAGEEIYNGFLFPEAIPGMPENLDDSSYGIVGGNRSEIMISQFFDLKHGSSNYVVSLDAANNMKPTIVWQTEGN